MSGYSNDFLAQIRDAKIYKANKIGNDPKPEEVTRFFRVMHTEADPRGHCVALETHVLLPILRDGVKSKLASCFCEIDQWQFILFPFLEVFMEEVEGGGSKRHSRRDAGRLFSLVMNVFALVHCHFFLTKPYVKKGKDKHRIFYLLDGTVERLKSYCGWDRETIVIARLMLSSVLHLLMNRFNTYLEEDLLHDGWRNLLQVFAMVEQLVLYSPLDAESSRHTMGVNTTEDLKCPDIKLCAQVVSICTSLLGVLENPNRISQVEFGEKKSRTKKRDKRRLENIQALKASLAFFEGCKACLLTIESRNYNNADASFEAFANAASKRRGAYRRGTHEQIKKTLTKALQAQMQAQVVASPLSRAERLLINGQEKKAPGGASERGSTEMSHESPNSSNSFKSVPSDGGRGAARDNKRGSALSKFSSVASTLGEEQGELNEESNEDEDQEQEDDSSVHMINYAEIKAKRRSVVNLKKGPLIPVKESSAKKREFNFDLGEAPPPPNSPPFQKGQVAAGDKESSNASAAVAGTSGDEKKKEEKQEKEEAKDELCPPPLPSSPPSLKRPQSLSGKFSAVERRSKGLKRYGSSRASSFIEKSSSEESSSSEEDSSDYGSDDDDYDGEGDSSSNESVDENEAFARAKAAMLAKDALGNKTAAATDAEGAKLSPSKTRRSRKSRKSDGRSSVTNSKEVNDDIKLLQNMRMNKMRQMHLPSSNTSTLKSPPKLEVKKRTRPPPKYYPPTV